MPRRKSWSILVSFLLVLLITATSSGAQDATTEATPEIQAEITAEPTSISTAEVTPDSTAEATSQPTVGATAEATLNPTTEVTVEATIEAAPDQPPVFNLSETTYTAVLGQPLTLKFTVSDDVGMTRVVAEGAAYPENLHVEMVAPEEASAPFNTGVIFTYQPAPDFVGSETITLTAIDSVGLTANLTLNLDVTRTEATAEATAEAALEDNVQGAKTFVVNSTGDGVDMNTADGICQTSTPNECTLRAAIMQANANAGADTINFNIPSDGVQIIQPQDFDLPQITETLTINGYSQPGAKSATASAPATLMIALKGNISILRYGLRISANNCLIKGLAISNFRTGIFLDGSAAVGNRIEGSYIGTDAAGTNVLGNGTGIDNSYAPSTIIGGTSPAARNLISGNYQGILVYAANEVRIQGNYIGTDVTGTLDLGNTRDGITVSSAPSIVIGGITAGGRNLISGNDNRGIDIFNVNSAIIQGNYIGTNIVGTVAIPNGVGISVSSLNPNIGGTVVGARNLISGNSGNGIELNCGGNRVQGNYIGTDVTGKLDLGNVGSGILVRANANIIGGNVANARNVISGNNGTGVSITSSGNLISGNTIGTTADGKGALGNSGNGISVGGDVSTNNVIGGTAAGAANVIAHNALDGINLGFTASASNTRLLNNQIYNNGGVGIDLDVSGSGGVTLNDANDTDNGPNSGQNFPVLNDVVSSGGIRILGTLDTNPGVYRLEFFANPTCDASGHGEGQQFIGRVTLETDASGDLEFDVTLPGRVAAGWVVTATATSASGNTSEFSACRALSTVRVPGKAALTSPRNRANITDTTPTYAWRTITGVTDYEIQVALDSSFVLIADSAAVSAATYDGATLTLGETYYWRVRAINSEGVPGAWSTVWSFSVVP
jgi:CSLREA domain-containing protein